MGRKLAVEERIRRFGYGEIRYRIYVTISFLSLFETAYLHVNENTNAR